MIIKQGKWPGRILLCLSALYFSGTSTLSVSADYAMQTPGAATSMLLDIAAAGDRLVAVGERGHILYSDDQGASWTQAEVPTSLMLTRVFFISPDVGWAAGHDGNILHTQDGGVNWDVQRDGITDQARINEERAGRAKQQIEALRARLQSAPEEEREDLVLELENAEWALDTAREALDSPVYAPPLMDIWFANDTLGWASGAYGTLLHTSNGGRYWQDWSHKVDNPDELHLNGVIGAPDGSLYMASEWGTVFRSASGEHWEPLATGYEGSFFGMALNPTSGTVFAYGLRGTVYRSTDSGETWEALQAKAQASLFGAHTDEDGSVIFVGQGGTATLTRDDGMSFTALIQHTRAGFHGVAPLGNGRYMAAGDGGSHELAAGPGAAQSPASTGGPSQ